MKYHINIYHSLALIATALLAALPVSAHVKPPKADPKMATDGSQRLSGSNPAERAAALVRYTASLKPKDELYPKAAASA